MLPVRISIAVEGRADEAVARRLVAWNGAEVVHVYGKRGKHWLDSRLAAFRAAAERAPWLVLRDADHDGCAVAIRDRLHPRPVKFFCFRIAVRSVESWLIADREGVGAALRIPVARVPVAPEAEPYPKRCLIDLARVSRSSQIKRMIVPRDGSGASVGPEYESWASTFAAEIWNPERAQQRSPSLKTAMARLQELVVAAAES